MRVMSMWRCITCNKEINSTKELYAHRKDKKCQDPIFEGDLDE